MQEQALGAIIGTTFGPDAQKISRSGLKSKVKKLIEILKINPYQNPPSYEKLTEDLEGMYSRRINIQHRLVYEVDDDKKKRENFNDVVTL